MLSDCCLSVCSVLSVTLVYCGQTVRWIKMKLSMEVGLGSLRPHCVRWGPSFPQKGQSPISGPCLLWPNGWMDEDATWYGGRPRPRRHCVRWWPSSPEGHSPSSPNFQPMFVVSKWLDGPRCHLVRRYALAQTTPHCVRWGSSSPKRGIARPHISAHVCCGQTAGMWSRWHLVRR